MRAESPTSTHHSHPFIPPTTNHGCNIFNTISWADSLAERTWLQLYYWRTVLSARVVGPLLDASAKAGLQCQETVTRHQLRESTVYVPPK